MLDEYRVPCVLADENASLYGGAPFAMPIRLLVDESEVERAEKILRGETLGIEEAGEVWEEDSASANRNPWELLAIAFPFLLTAVALLARNQSLILAYRRFGRVVVTPVSLAVTRGVAVLALVVSATLIWGYLSVRRSATRSGLPGEMV